MDTINETLEEISISKIELIDSLLYTNAMINQILRLLVEKDVVTFEELSDYLTEDKLDVIVQAFKDSTAQSDISKEQDSESSNKEN